MAQENLVIAHPQTRNGFLKLWAQYRKAYLRMDHFEYRGSPKPKDFMHTYELQLEKFLQSQEGQLSLRSFIKNIMSGPDQTPIIGIINRFPESSNILAGILAKHLPYTVDDDFDSFLLRIDEEFYVSLRAIGWHSDVLSSAHRDRPRLELDEGRKRFRIDNNWYEYTGDRAGHFLFTLMKAKGVWESGPNLVRARASRADRVYKALPSEIKKIIQSKCGGTGGYRIIPEFFDLT